MGWDGMGWEVLVHLLDYLLKLEQQSISLPSHKTAL